MVEESMVENSLKAQGSRLDKNGRDNIVVPLYSKYTDNGVYFQIKLNIQFTPKGECLGRVRVMGNLA